MTPIRTTPLHSDFVVEVHASIPDVLDDPGATKELEALWHESPVMIFRRQALEESELVRSVNISADARPASARTSSR